MDSSTDAFTALPDPGQAKSLDELAEQLRLLKVWAGNPSYETIAGRISKHWRAAGRPEHELARKSTVADSFKTGRRRISSDLVLAIVRTLHDDAGYLNEWRQALRVLTGELQAAAQVKVQDSLPEDLPAFTGRAAELDAVRAALTAGGPVVVSAIEGMAGVGKTQLAVHAAHLLADEKAFDQVLFVNLRGFHPDPAEPPADPHAVLDGFLRLLGMSEHQIPASPDARIDAYRNSLVGSRTLVLLDNAADEAQVRALLPYAEGCLTLVTSRRSLLALDAATRVAVDVFTPAEAIDYLAEAVPGFEVDPDALSRIAARCGYLPLALGLVAGRIRGSSGWTLSDHADRLEERHRERRMDSDVELALGLSYQHLPSTHQRLLRLAALHPGQDLDAYAAAALTETDLATAETTLRELHEDHLLQANTPGRYTFHDLVRAYAAVRAGDEERPPERKAALTRVFDYYLATAAAAMNVLHPSERMRRPSVAPAPGPAPVLTDAAAALDWLNAERVTLVAVSSYSADREWPAHATALSTTLVRYFSGAHNTDGVTVHRNALRAADRTGAADRARALTHLGMLESALGRVEQATEYCGEALTLFRQVGDPLGQAIALGMIGNALKLTGRYDESVAHHEEAISWFQRAGDLTGEASALVHLGQIEERRGLYEQAAGRHRRALELYQASGSLAGEANARGDFGAVLGSLGRFDEALESLDTALEIWQRLNYRSGEAATLDSIGTALLQLGRRREAAERYEQSLTIFREIGESDGQVWALNGLGEAMLEDGQATEAIAQHAEALAIATENRAPDHIARANAGLGRARESLGEIEQARRHYEQAITLYAELGSPAAEELRERLAALG
ncbi:tetratricopeptide repeat protein [Kribbella endophytica]